MYCIEVQLEKIIWINFIISTKIEKKCLIKAVMKFLGWNCSATTAKVENYSEKKSSFTQSLPNPPGKNKSQDSSRLCKTALHFNFDIPLKQCAFEAHGRRVAALCSSSGQLHQIAKTRQKLAWKKSWNWLIRLVPAIECEAHVMTGNGSFVKLLDLARKNLWKHIKLNLFLAGFNRLEPLWVVSKQGNRGA